MKVLLKKLDEYFKSHNYEVDIFHEFDKYGVLYLTLTYKKISTRLYFNKRRLSDKIKNMTYEQLEKYIEQTAINILYDTTN